MFRTALFAFLILACGHAASAEPFAHPIYGIGGDNYGLSPFWDWKSIETAHFRLSFPAELAEVAEKCANYLEEAHLFLTKELFWEPGTTFRTQILVVDNTDESNGLTSAVARLGIVLFVTPPENSQSISYYDDWLRLLSIHEYTHYVNLDATKGVFTVTRYLFGDLLLPNEGLPSWMLEGLAVYMETRHTGAGRGRSSFYEAILRTAVDEQTLGTSSFITLDKVNGYNPWYPFGETAYLFGYHLTDELVRDTKLGPTADGDSVLKKPTDVLGELSIRGAARLPWFLDDNLQNVAGRDWPTVWTSWIDATASRERTDLAKIHTQPVTELKPILERSHEKSNVAIGPRLSPDGRWLAFTWDSPDLIQSFYLREISTGINHRVENKTGGTMHAFSPDSKFVFYSTLNRHLSYYLWSDLRVYDIDRDRSYALTDSLRAFDPDVSRDGKWITFTVSEQGGATSLALAPLIFRDGRYELGEIRKSPAGFDNRVSTPKFSADARKIYFTMHPNGKFQEDLLELDRESWKTRTLLSDGHFNRFPAVHPDGDVFFVSDATGVDNLYRLREGSAPELRSNVTGGIYFPSFRPDGKSLFATSLSFTGQDLVEFGLSDAALDPREVTVAAPPIPESDAPAPAPEVKQYPVKDYSAWPTLAPRIWPFYPEIPGITADFPPFIMRAKVIGADAIDRHEYELDASYYAGFNILDGTLTYSNRSLGPTIAAAIFSGFAAPTLYTNESYPIDTGAAISAAFPWQFTYSTLTPTLAVEVDRQAIYTVGVNNNNPVAFSPYVPQASAALNYNSRQSTALSITPEEGRVLSGGMKGYLDLGVAEPKFLVQDAEYFRLFGHAVLVPQVKALWTAIADPNYIFANAVAAGRAKGSFFNIPNYVGFDLTSVRGYPQQTFIAKSLIQASVDFRFPLFQIFRGYQVLPLFLQQFYGSVFGEATIFPYGEYGTVIASAGVSLKLSLDFLIRIPVVLAVDYQQGFMGAQGGAADIFPSISANFAF